VIKKRRSRILVTAVYAEVDRIFESQEEHLGADGKESAHRDSTDRELPP
jgi:hypothetical protein